MAWDGGCGGIAGCRTGSRCRRLGLSDGTLSRIDALTGAPRRTVSLGGSPTGVAAGLDAVWVSDPDQIVLKLGASPSAELTAVERGSADYTVDDPPANRMNEVRTRFASQLHINPTDDLDMLVLNTRRAPFNDLRVRRALNYAVDRGKIARLVGSASRPTCQFLTP